MKRYVAAVALFGCLACAGPSSDTDLVQKDEVQKVVNKLFVQTDNRNWPEVRTCFDDTVLFDMTSLAGGEPARLTPEQITEAWDAGLKPLQAIHHQVGNFDITVSGDKAEVFCYGIAIHYLQNPSNRNTRTFVGSYDFELIRTADGWKISLFRFNSKFIDGNLSLESSSHRAAQ